MTDSFDSSGLSSETPHQPSSRPSQTASLFTPFRGPQTRAFESEAFITGYGGAAGGGKSLLEIGLAISQHRKSIIFRRHKEDVKDLWSKMRMLCGDHGRSNESSKEWHDLPGDRYVRLVGLQHEWDWMKYQGNENDLWCFDEATQFSEMSIRTLIAWCRSPDPQQRCRVVLGFNPPTTSDGLWIIEFFAPWLDPTHPNPAEPGELRWFAVVDGKEVARPDGTPFEHNGPKGRELITPLSRTFIPARLEDNPILDGTNYRSVLQGMPEPLRSQMLYGDFTVGLTDHEWQVIPTAWVRQAQERWHPEGRGRRPLTAIGCDVAQGGSDNTLLQRRYGSWYAEPEVHPGATVPDANVNAGYVLRALAEGGVAHIDADGIGSATYFLVKAKASDRTQSFLGSDQKVVHGETDGSGLLGFFNKRAMAWWRFREKLDPARNPDIALPPGRRILSDLTAPHYEIVGGKIKLERKPDIIKRLGFSPDYGDAIVMADAEPSFGSQLAEAYRNQWGAA